MLKTLLKSAMIALVAAAFVPAAGVTAVEAAQKHYKKKSAQQYAKRKKLKRPQRRSGVRYNFGTWERDTTYEGYCDNSHYLGIPTVSCRNFRHY